MRGFFPGRSSSGQLGLAPSGGGRGVEIAAGDALVSGVAHVSAGGFHSAVVTMDGSLVTFGDNQFGQLGRSWLCTGEAGRGQHGPAVVALDTQATADAFRGSGEAVEAACGRYHTIVLCADGSVRTFGRGLEGQLGGMQFELKRSVAGVVSAVGEDNVAVAAGGYHSLVAKASGAVMSFGRNTHGQLCTGSTEDESYTPRLLDLATASGVSGAYADVGLISGGAYHTLLVLRLPGAGAGGDEGTALYGCGRNREGQLGLGDKVVIGRYEQIFIVDDTDDRFIPTAVPTFGIAQNAADAIMQIAAGGWHSLVLLTSGTVHSFGSNDAGQLGIGLDTFNQPRQADGSPVDVTADYLSFATDNIPPALRFVHPKRVCVDCGIVAIAAGGQTSLLVKSAAVEDALDASVNGALLCPGAAAVANSSEAMSTLATRARNGLSTRSASCGVMQGSAVYGFGRNDDGQLGSAGGGSATASSDSIEPRVARQTPVGLGCLDGRYGGIWKVVGGIDGPESAVNVAAVSAIAVGWHHALIATGLQCRGGTAAGEIAPTGCPTRVCAACAPGRWKTRNSGSAAGSDCRACGPGSIATQVDTRAMALADTNRDGLLSEIEWATSNRPLAELARIHSDACTACTAGTASMQADGSAVETGACELCIAGQYALTGAARCTACPRGRYSTETGNTDSEACIGCPSGKHSTTLGAAAESHCVPCPAGSFPTGVSAGVGSSSCTLCPPGRSMASGAAALAEGCEACRPGQYSAGFPAPGAAECVDCAAGRFLYDPPLSGVALELLLQSPHAPCEECRIGLWSDVVGAYGDSTDRACKGCPTGKYSRQAGADSVENCKIRNELAKTSAARHASQWVAILSVSLGAAKVF